MALHNSPLRQILFTGLIAGTLDITAASVQFFMVVGKGPEVILRFIAGALFGSETANSHASMPWVGLLLHYVIAISFAACYFWLYPRIKTWASNWLIAGVLYGLLVWCVMNLVVVPLSHIGPRPFHLVNVLIGAGILVVCIGIPIAYLTHRYYVSQVNP